MWYGKIWMYYKIARITDTITYFVNEEAANAKFEAIWLPIMSLLANQQVIPFDLLREITL